MSKKNEKRLAKIGRCAESVKKQTKGTSKESAIRICSKSIGGKKK